MGKNKIISDFNEFQLKSLMYTLNTDDEMSPSLDIRYPLDDSDGLQRVYLKTPTLMTGDLCHYNKQDLLVLQIIDSRRSSFRDTLVMLDQYHLAQVESNQKIWGFSGSVPQAVLSQYFRNIVNYSGKTGKEFLVIDFDNNPVLFDQYDNRISIEQVEKNCECRAVLELDGMRRHDNGDFYTKINLVQLKVKLPEFDNSTESIEDSVNTESTESIDSKSDKSPEETKDEV